MSIYPHRLSHGDAHDHTERAKEIEENKLYVNSKPSSESTMKKEVDNFFIITFIVEVLLLGFVAILEYFLRWTEIFPLRQQNFSCTDPEISHVCKDILSSEFSFHADVSPEAIYSLSFCVPPFVILITEIGMWSFGKEPERVVIVICNYCKVPQIIRRLARFTGIFLFGAVTLMIFVDVMKMMIGRLRPNFLEICQLNITACQFQNDTGGNELCLTSDLMLLRDARMSFPSKDSALTAYSAIFLAIYIHYGTSAHTMKMIRIFLTLVFCMMAMLCGLAEIGMCKSHWTDVVAGTSMGVVMAVYLGGFVLHSFQEHSLEKKMLESLRLYLIKYHSSNSKKKDRYNTFYDGPEFHIPRVQMSPPHSGESSSSNKHRAHVQDSFQRDLSHVIEHYRRGSPTQASTHM